MGRYRWGYKYSDIRGEVIITRYAEAEASWKLGGKLYLYKCKKIGMGMLS